jgi:hypothetical protein
LLRRTFFELPTLFGISVELVLAAVGFVVLLRRVATCWWSGERHGPASALAWWLFAYLFGIGANLSLDWPRYYVPTAFYGSILIGLGARALLAAAIGWRTAPSRPTAGSVERESGRLSW